MLAADLGATLANMVRPAFKADAVMRAVENRCALAALELEEAGQRLESAIVWSALSAIALLLAGVTFTAVIAAVFWDTSGRVPALLVLACAEIAVAAGAAWYVATRWRRWQAFQHSRDQLAKDSACIREILGQDRA